MATIYKCDKCKKVIKGARRMEVRLNDMSKILGDKIFYSCELCEKCAKPLVKNFNKFF